MVKKIDEVAKKKRDLKKLLKFGKYSYGEIQKELGVDYAYARKLVQLVRDTGVTIAADYTKGQKYFWMPREPMASKTELSYTLKPNAKGWYRFGVVSDTHLGSKYACKDGLHNAYDHYEKEKIKLVFNAGDGCDGDGHVYRGHLNDIEVYGYDKIVELCIDDYPIRKGVKTVMLSGNHDLSFYKKGGGDPMKALCAARPDIDYMGQMDAWTNLNKSRLYAMHPDGGTGYARSYKLQRMIEQLEEKPDILLRGHHHIALYMPYLGVHAIEAGCFQHQTPYMARKGLKPDIGCWIVEFKQDKNEKITELRTAWRPYKKL